MKQASCWEATNTRSQRTKLFAIVTRCPGFVHLWFCLCKLLN